MKKINNLFCLVINFIVIIFICSCATNHPPAQIKNEISAQEKLPQNPEAKYIIKGNVKFTETEEHWESPNILTKLYAPERAYDPIFQIVIKFVDNNQTFEIDHKKSFIAEKNHIFILELMKQGKYSNEPSSALRTFIKWNGNGFESITGDKIIVNSQTTAMTLISEINPSALTPEETMGKIKVDNDNTIIQDINSQTTVKDIESVKNILEEIFRDKESFEGQIIYINNAYQKKASYEFQKRDGKLSSVGTINNLAGSLTSNSFLASWDRIETATGYIVYVLNEDNNTIATYKVDGINNTQLLINGLFPSTHYSYFVRAKYQKGKLSNISHYLTKFTTLPLGMLVVNSQLQEEQNYPSIAVNDNGKSIITFHSYADYFKGKYYSAGVIFARVFNPDQTSFIPKDCNLPKCNPITGEFSIKSETSLRPGFPKTAIDNQGNFLITWEEVENSGNITIYFQRFDPTAKPIIPSGCFLPDCNPQTGIIRLADGEKPDVAMDENGNLVIVWQRISRKNDGIDYYDLWLRKYINYYDKVIPKDCRLPDCNPLTGDLKVASFKSINDKILSSVLIDNTGVFTIFWNRYSSDKKYFELSALRFNKDVSLIKPDKCILPNCNPESGTLNLKVPNNINFLQPIKTDIEGNFHILFTRGNVDIKLDLVKYSSSGDTLSQVDCLLPGCKNTLTGISVNSSDPKFDSYRQFNDYTAVAFKNNHLVTSWTERFTNSSSNEIFTEKFDVESK